MMRRKVEETAIATCKIRPAKRRQTVWLLGLSLLALLLLAGRSLPPALAAIQEPGPTPSPPPTATPAASPTPRADGSVVYEVVAGDTLLGIAARFDVSPDDIYAYNNLTPDSVLQVGQSLILVPATGATPAPSPTAGATTLPAGVTLTEAGLLVHQVVTGDTLLAIANQYDLTLEELLALNEGLTRASVLQVGQTIVVGQQRQQPASTGGSTDQPGGTTAATIPATAVATFTPLPTLTLAPATATSAATAAAQLLPTAASPVPPATAAPVLATPAPAGTGLADILLPLGMALVALLLVAGVLLVYLGRS